MSSVSSCFSSAWRTFTSWVSSSHQTESRPNRPARRHEGTPIKRIIQKCYEQGSTVLEISNGTLSSVPPEIGDLRKLRGLWLKDNRLRELFGEIANLCELRDLYLSHNRFRAFPHEVFNLPNLRHLDLSHNELRELPHHIGNLQSLWHLNLDRNLLETIPDSIFRLPDNCEVSLEMNRLSPEYVRQFQQRQEIYRQQNQSQGPYIITSTHDDIDVGPNLSLEERLQSWSTEFQTLFPNQHPPANLQNLLELNEDEEEVLSHYLRRLRDIKDYQCVETRRSVVLRVGQMVQLACTNEEFRQRMLALMNEGLGRCGDRITLAFNDIEFQWQLCHRELTDAEFCPLAIRIERYNRLQKYATTIARERGLGDQVETILYYLIHLKEALNLPFTNYRMLSPSMSGVTDEMLAEARTRIEAIPDEELLRTSDHWQERLSRRYPEQAEEINSQFENLLQNAQTYYGIENRESRAKFLQDHEDLAHLLNDSKITHFSEAARIIQIQQREALARL